MNEMVERVAAAITAEFEPYRSFDEGDAERLARAAIAAMREPTEGMELAGDQVGHYSDAPAATSVWQAMIDEALK